MDKLPINMQERQFTPESVAKSDKDIKTIESLSQVAERCGAFLALSGGYATESLCGGKVVRSHGDIDARFIFPEPHVNKEASTLIGEVLMAEDTKWEVYKSGAGNIEYRENNESKPFFDRRRIEIYFPVKGFYDVEFENGQLIDSNGKVVNVKTLSLVDLVASKVKTLYSFKDGFVDTRSQRETSVTDLQDLKRLMSLTRLDKMAVVKILAKKNSLEMAEEQWNYALKKIRSLAS